MKLFKFFLFGTFVLGLMTFLTPCIAQESGPFEIEIDVSPKTLNIQSEGEVVTVHTDIAYWIVDGHTVLLNGVAIQSWKADNRGNFVAKFLMGAIKDLNLDLGEVNTLALAGYTKDGISFFGTADVMVIDVTPKGKGR
jgi:hypothetical protein